MVSSFLTSMQGCAERRGRVSPGLELFVFGSLLEPTYFVVTVRATTFFSTASIFSILHIRDEVLQEI